MFSRLLNISYAAFVFIYFDTTFAERTKKRRSISDIY